MIDNALFTGVHGTVLDTLTPRSCTGEQIE